jgi:hypothetical protein
VRKNLFLIVVLVLLSAPAQAHHSFSAEYDAHNPQTLRGVITRVDWVNPHASIHMNAKNAAGKLESWTIETSSPNTLLRDGFTKESLLPGTAVSVEGYPAKTGEHKLKAVSIRLWVRSMTARFSSKADSLHR